MNPRRRDLLIASGAWLLMPATAFALPSAPRRLDLTNPNTHETFNGPYRDADGPIPSAIADLRIFLRDFHANKVGPVSLVTLDFLADVMAAVGETKATILSAYRTPETNRMLRAKYFGVAEKSQHLLGNALDVTFNGRIGKAEQAALAMRRGGVGWYPNSHFIHLDSGPVRHWAIEMVGLDAMLSGHGPRRPLTVRERLRLQHELAHHELLKRRGR
ncbi:MAG TPA: DUF882 domain-containing protein [Stellaceae bacterium]